jgi:hypothetical protein
VRQSDKPTAPIAGARASDSDPDPRPPSHKPPPRTGAQRQAKYRSTKTTAQHAQDLDRQAKYREQNREQIRAKSRDDYKKNRDHHAELYFRFHPRIRTEHFDGFLFTNPFHDSRPTFQIVDPRGAHGLEEWETPDEMTTRMKLTKQIPCDPQELKRLQKKAAKKEGPNVRRKTPKNPTGDARI